jgi:hypothetical protein
MKSIIITVVTLVNMVVFSNRGNATSVPWVGVLDSTHPIVVPAGKILLVKNISASTTGAQLFTIAGSAAGGIGSGTFSTTFYFDVGPLGSTTITPTTLQLGPGMTLSVASGSYPVFGEALDTSDYIALASPLIRSASYDGTQLATTFDSRTTAATTTTAKVSSDLATWTNSDITIAKSLSNPRLTKVTTPNDSQQKFLRANTTMSD